MTVAGDEDALRRAVGNLIENGLVHGPARGHVTVSLDVVGDRALLSVTDQGPGPDPEQHGQLFERFWRGPGAVRAPRLGARAVDRGRDRRRIISGRVRVDGSTFTLDLPVARTPAAVRAGQPLRRADLRRRLALGPRRAASSATSRRCTSGRT